MLEIFKILSEVLFALTILLIIICIKNKNKVKRNIDKIKDISQLKFYRDLLDITNNYTLLKVILRKINKEYSLIVGHEVLSLVYSLSILFITPCIMLASFILLSIFVPGWYGYVFNIVFSFLIPILAIRSKLRNKGNKIRLELGKNYKTFGSSLAANPKIEHAFNLVINNNHGSVRRIFTQLQNGYLADRDKACEEFAYKIGDPFSEAFCKALITFEDTGVLPTSVMSNISNKCILKYGYMNRMYSSMFEYKILGLVCVLGTMMIFFLSGNLLATMQGTPFVNPFSHANVYIVVVIECLYFLLCYLYENI